MRRFLRWLFALVFVALAGAAVFVAFNAERLLDRYAPFELREQPDWLTRFHLYYVRANPEKCFAVLARSEVQFSRQQFPLNDRGCGFDDGVLLTKQSVSYGGGVLLRCQTAVSLILWERHVLQQEAERVLKKKVRAVQSFGTFSCRNVNHQKQGRLSQHATANAIDIAGFTFEDGSNASVLKDWDKDERGAFLRAVRDGACRFFAGVLSPDYNAAHANHFHFDMGRWGTCR
ncbi:MAG: extensin family protein [Xanthobacteraceae bacterium]|nr:extensin family protein [Xanthobacteraceae bacterium]QYK44952.1 MAG: extensin family protein [Xanthobacteraceae bacterium]